MPSAQIGSHSGVWGYPRLSVALCTFNGEDYLPEQLESLLTQTRPPDELVVCDDASTDATYSILETFAARAPFPIRLRRNPARLGVTANFQQAIRLCEGDVIALSDQDDVWLPRKLERFHSLFAASPELGWAFCDADVVDSELGPLGYTMWGRVSFTQLERRRARQGLMFNVLLKHYVVAGATMAFRRELREHLLPVPAGWPYDAWLALAAAAVSRPGLIEEPLQRYRQHGANAVGGRRKGMVAQVREALTVGRERYYREELARWNCLAERLEATPASSAAGRALAGKLAHLRRRSHLPNHRLARIPQVMAEIFRGDYGRYARNWGSIALDLLFK
jgi:glycosyltransferase involved in cell wall biosynthesis